MTNTQLSRWKILHPAAMISCLPALLFLETVLPLALIGFLSFLWFIKGNIEQLKTYRPFGGYANLVTFLRLCLTISVGLFHSLLDKEVIAVVALVVILLDGVDGYLARKYGAESEWGADFDMEIDALFVCVMASLIFLKGYLGPWILPIGYLRYLYVVLLLLPLKLEEGGEHSRLAQTIAVILFCSLVTPFLFDRYVYLPCVLSASILVLLSFFISFVRTIRRRG